MLKLSHRHHLDLSRDDPRYRQVTMLYTILTIMVVFFGAIGLLNVFLFQAYAIATADFIGCALALAIYAYLQRYKNYQRASLLVVSVLIFILAGFIYLAQGSNYSLIWVTILPPIAYFLLGTTLGTWITALVFVAVLSYVAIVLPGVPAKPFGLGAWLNFAEVLLALFFIFRHYERSRSEAYARVQAMSLRDPLTGLANRLRLDQDLQTTLTLAQRTNQPTTVIMVDIDHFKRINDKHGHLVGDQVIIQVGAVLRDHVRLTDQVGRWGGEEFLIICPDTNQAGALVVTDKLREALARVDFPQQLQVTLSFGIATVTGLALPEDILQAADQQLYLAKTNGRNQARAVEV